MSLASHVCPPCEEAEGMTERAQIAAHIGRAAVAVQHVEQRALRTLTEGAHGLTVDQVGVLRHDMADVFVALRAILEVVTKLAAKIAG